MKKTYIPNSIFILLLSFSFINCITSDSKRKDTPKNTNNIGSVKNKVIPIFNGLSPKMSYKEFKEVIQSKPLNDPIRNDEFTIPINDDYLTFKISKEKEKIILNYSNVIKYHKIDFPPERLEKYLNEDNLLINKLLKIYKKKYPINVAFELPFKKSEIDIYMKDDYLYDNGTKKVSLLDYGYNKDNYKFFRDSIKTVMVGFNIINYRIPISYDELKKSFQESTLSNTINRPFKINYDSNHNDSEQLNHEIKIGVEIEIQYYHNSDFDIIKEKINQDFRKFKNLKNTSDRKKIEKDKRIKQNLEKI